MLRRTVGFCLPALTLLLCAFSVSVACQEKERVPNRYLIPNGYVGWVKVCYKVKDAHPLPIEEGHYLFTFPSSGVLNTSSDTEYGWAVDEYYYYSADHSRTKLESTGWDEGGMIWAESVGQSGKAPLGVSSSKDIAEENKTFYSRFFVGTEAEYTAYGRWVNDDEKSGPINKQAIKRQKKERTDNKP